MFEHSADAVVLLTEQGLVRYASQSTRQVLGITPEAFVGVDWFRPVHPEDLERVRGCFAECLARPGQPVEVECRIRHADGSWRVQECVYVNRLAEPRIGAIMVNKRDITARKEAEAALVKRTEELAQSNSDLEKFAYVASHDLQEPLRMVSSFTQLLAKRYEGKLDAEADEFIHYALGGAQTMQALIRDLLAFSQVGSQGQEMVPTPLAQVVDQAWALVQFGAPDLSVSLDVEGLPTLSVDQGQMTQLFRNLLGNALKFRADRPLVLRVGARQDPQGWTLWVKDNGIGLDPKFKERIFVIFQRLHPRDEYPGTGIGLSICKRILERHGGTIRVESEPGAGSTFFFRLPLIPI
jgi:PAS domain S-box-containing protein